jgi:hypothetical protein
MQWLEKGVPGPVKAKGHATRIKTLGLVFFFYFQGIAYNLYVPTDKTVDSIHIVQFLQEFLRRLKKNRPNLSSWE